MRKFPTISVCLPAYNGEQFIAEALQSVTEQTYEDIEIIIVDDCSGDHTFKIAEDFSERDNRIRVFKNDDNLGLVSNWQKCIGHARGEYIKFLFQDDILIKDCIQKMAGATSGGQYPFIVCGRTYFFERNVVDEIRELYSRTINLSDLYRQETYLSKDVVQNLADMFFLRNFVGEPVCYLFKKELIEKYGLFNHDLLQLCDLEFALRITLNEGMVYMPESLVKFRVHNNSESIQNLSSRRKFKHVRSKIFDRLVLLSLIDGNAYFSGFKSLISRKRGSDFIEREFSVLLEKSINEVGYRNTREIMNKYYNYYSSIGKHRLPFSAVIKKKAKRLIP